MSDDKEILSEVLEINTDVAIKNYYVFTPYAFICNWVQADKEGLVETENWSQIDKICKTKKMFSSFWLD